MNLTEMLGPPVSDVDDMAEVPGPACAGSAIPPVPQHRPVRQHRLRTVALAAAVALAGFGAGASLAHDNTGAPAGMPSEAPTEVIDFAGFFVAIHLGGRAVSSNLEGLDVGNAALLSPEETKLWVNRAAAIGAQSAGDGAWVITVAADVLERVNGVYREAGVQYFEVTVAEGDETPVLVTGPARVPPPAATSAASGFDVALDADQAAAARSFLDAYLTGAAAESNRYLVAGSGVSLFGSAPYDEVDVVSMRGDGTGNVAAVLVATDRQGAKHSLEYALGMRIEEGEWRVTGMSVPYGSSR